MGCPWTRSPLPPFCLPPQIYPMLPYIAPLFALPPLLWLGAILVSNKCRNQKTTNHWLSSHCGPSPPFTDSGQHIITLPQMVIKIVFCFRFIIGDNCPSKISNQSPSTPQSSMVRKAPPSRPSSTLSVRFLMNPNIMDYLPNLWTGPITCFSLKPNKYWVSPLYFRLPNLKILNAVHSRKPYEPMKLQWIK